MPNPVAAETATRPTIRSSSTCKVGEERRRSILFRTTICGRPSSPAPYAASSRSISRNCSAGSPAAASITCTSSRARSRCARNAWPSPTPSLAPSIRPGTSATTSCRPSDASTVPRTGESVVNGYSATFGRAFEIRVRSDDLPAFGRPTSAASARSLRRSSISRSWPGRPISAKRGVCRLGPAKCLLPRPPAPPPATTTRAPTCARSATSSSPSKTCVPTGTSSTASSPRAPFERRPPPPPPRPARSFWFGRKPERSRRLGSATSTTSPPSPPSPPSGPPRGTYFSRRKWIEPSPPRPAIAVSRARSWNMALLVDDRHEAALAARPEGDLAIAHGEDRVVPADPGAGAGAEARTALPDEDHPRRHVLAGEELHAEHLRIRVAAVPRRAEPLLVCHYYFSSSADSNAASAPLRALP